MKYAEMTSPEIGRVSRKVIAVLPLGAVEQHGQHLPVVTDTAIASELGRRLEATLPGKVALLPTLWCGSSHHHKGFPGTISLRSETYVQVLIDLVESLIETGFQRIFLLNGHGGNQTPFAETLYRLNLRHRGPREPWVVAASYWQLAAREIAEQKFMKSARLSHACEYETSLMLAIEGRLVKPGPRRGETAGIGSRFYDPLGYTPSRVSVCQSFDQMSANGALGSPGLATAKKGEALLDLLMPPLIEFVEEFGSWKRRAFKTTKRPRTSISGGRALY